MYMLAIDMTELKEGEKEAMVKYIEQLALEEEEKAEAMVKYIEQPPIEEGAR